MSRADVISSLMAGDRIRHIKRETEYEVVSHARGKVCGEWVPGMIYRCCESGEPYWRSVHDFCGFEVQS